MYELTEAEVVHCEEGFQLFDLDGDGLMKPDEYKSFMQALTLYPSDEEIQEVFETKRIHEDIFAIDSTCVVSVLNEYLSSTRDEDRLRAAFAVFDHEESGFVLASEIKYMLMNFGNKLTDEQVTELYREIYINDDSEIFYEEFVDALRPEVYEVIIEDYTDTESSSENISEY